MVTFTQGNLLDGAVEALVNTVNTVGVMGKGIALMFKEAFPGISETMRTPANTRKSESVEMFVTENRAFEGRAGLSTFQLRSIGGSHQNLNGS